jgi:hypothetical protein
MKEKWFFPPHPREVGLSVQEALSGMAITSLPTIIFGAVYFLILNNQSSLGLISILLQIITIVGGIVLNSRFRARFGGRYNKIQHKALGEYLAVIMIVGILVWITASFGFAKLGGR